MVYAPSISTFLFMNGTGVNGWSSHYQHVCFYYLYLSDHLCIGYKGSGLLGFLENLELLEFSWNFISPPGKPGKPGISLKSSWNSFPQPFKNHLIRFFMTFYRLGLGIFKISACGASFLKNFRLRRSFS